MQTVNGRGGWDIWGFTYRSPEFPPEFMRAEALDCVVYAFAARHLVTANMDRRKEELSTPAALPPVVSPVIRSKWMKR